MNERCHVCQPCTRHCHVALTGLQHILQVLVSLLLVRRMYGVRDQNGVGLGYRLWDADVHNWPPDRAMASVAPVAMMKAMARVHGICSLQPV